MAVKMIDISDKALTLRTAVASAKVIASKSLISKIKAGRLPKGDCLAAAEIAGVLAAKHTPAIVPLCHPVRVTAVAVDFTFCAKAVAVRTTVRARDATGVEMEALAACAAAALTVYDMAKTEEKGIVISDLKLLKKTGGKSGDYIR